jgi:para-aminobenzoate synthetase/4-amino-4-deoxychorismate lyase
MNADPSLGVFDTMLAVRGRPIALDSHLSRMAASVTRLYGGGEPPAAEIRDAAAAAHLPHRIRVTARPTGERSLEWRTETERVHDTLADPRPEFGWRLSAVTAARGLGAHKWCDRAPLDELRARAEVPDFDDVLLIDRDGRVLEGGRTNIFAVVGRELVTPPCDGRILPGVARHVVLELARARGVRVRVRPVATIELQQAAEVFVTNSIRGVQPVLRCGGRVEDEWQPGPLTELLRSALVAEWLGRAVDEPRAS